MDQITQQNAAMVKQSTAASHPLKGQAAQLVDLVGRIVISGAVADPGRLQARRSTAGRSSVAASRGSRIDWSPLSGDCVLNAVREIFSVSFQFPCFFGDAGEHGERSLEESFGSIRATLVVLTFLAIGPLMGGLALYGLSPFLVPGKTLDPYFFRGWVYWVFVYGYGLLSALSVGGIMAAYGGDRLRFRVVITASLIVGAAFCAFVFRNDNFGPKQLPGELRLISIALAIHVLAGVSTLAILKLLLRL